MNTLLQTLIAGRPISDQVLADELYEICDSEHASCNSNCPVYELNGNKVPDTANDFNVNRGCDCFKSGVAMLQFIRAHSN